MFSSLFCTLAYVDSVYGLYETIAAPIFNGGAENLTLLNTMITDMGIKTVKEITADAFNLNKVMIKKDVLAPYRDGNGNAKDWFLENGKKYRLTAPSNVWTDITIPYWSMKENTEHPTQKPEKLIAKLILASSNENDLVLDPFLGSGTTSVVAKKLKRNYIGIEIDAGYASICEKRLENINETIQGYNGKYFLARGTKE